MKVIYYSNGNIKPESNTKYAINFFGILECIKVNEFSKDIYKNKKVRLNVVRHYFDYPYFSRVVNLEFFLEELDNEEKKLLKG